MNADVLDFTRRALDKGLAREDIAEALRQAGWSDADVRSANGAFAPIAFPVPVPRPRPYLSAYEVFVYALMFTALYASAFHLGALAFQFIDRALPDPGVSTAGAILKEGMRFNIAGLIVGLPLFLFLFASINRAIAKDPTRRQSRPRKWLTYLTLFVAAAVLLGDVSTLVYQFLGGELTSRFTLKVVTVGVIASGALGYFLTDARQDERP